MIRTPLPIPPPDVPLVDTQSGRINTDWYRFFKAVFDALAALLGWFGTGSTVVASLPAAAKAGAGARAFVTDATATTFHSTVAGGGSNKVPVVSDGTNWLIG